MGFVWDPLAVNDKVLYAANVQIDELRDNADWIDDNMANRTYNGTIDATADFEYDATLNTSVQATDDYGYDGTLLSGQLNGQNSPVNSSNYSSNFPTYNALCGCNSK